MSSVTVGAQEILGRKGQYIGALIIRTRFWGPLYYNYDTYGTPKNSIGNYLGPYSNCITLAQNRLLICERLESQVEEPSRRARQEADAFAPP